MKIRKGLSILLSVCMLFCMAPLAVSADESAYDAVPGGSQEYADTAVEESEEIYMPAEEQTEVPAEEQTEIPAEEQVDYQTEDQSEDSVTEEAVPHEHSYFAIETSDPTCTEQGYTVFSCACGDRYTEYSAVLGHDWDGGVVTAEPTAESEGVLTYTCSRCGENRAEQIPVPETEEEVPTDVHEHSYIAEETVGPTCTEQGYTVYTCSCGDTYTEITDPLEHEWDEGIVTLEPTAENEGEITYTCIRCGEIKTENIEIIDEEVPDEDISVEEAYATKPTKLWLEPSEANGIPVRIDVFAKRTGGTNYNPTYTYLLCLPGNAVLENCFLSWDGDMRATLDGQTYDSGTCPIPAIGSPKTYTFRNGNQTAASFNVVAYQGSLAVHPVFIEIDESLGTIAAMNSDKNNTCSGTIYIDGVQYVLDKMKGRGNATWTESDDKKPYNITLGTKITFGLNTPKTKKWSFMAEVLDRSLLSNRSGFWLAEQLGIGQATTSADVWMNGEYKGCYMVTPKTDSYVTDNGFMVEQDNYKEDSVANGGDPQFSLDGLVSRVSGWSSAYNLITVKKMGDNLLLNNGVVDESPANMEAAASMIQAWLQDAWDAIRSETGYNAKGKYYTDYIDIDSFAKMYLMHEYIKSYDVCAGSILFHRDGQTDTDKLIAGPLWDLDNAMGAVYQNSSLGKADDRSNGDRRSAEGYFISNITYNGDANLEYKTSIYKALGKHEDFMQAVKIQYNQYKWAFDSLPGVVDELIDEIRASAQMNHAKVNDIGHGTGKDNHYYSRAQSFGSGQYRQSYIATSQ